MLYACRCINCLTPPHLLRKLAESDDRDIRERALNTLLTSATIRGERNVRSLFGDASPSEGRRTIYDCGEDTDLTNSTVARTEDGDASTDDSVNNAFEGLGKTRDFYKSVFNRDSIDDRGMRLDAYVHFDRGFNNAFWDGSRMIFGDGDGRMFSDFTGSLDVIGHELTHGVTQSTAALEYSRQPGALNESMSDVFGSLIKQWALGQTAETADWLIGAEIFTPMIKGDALRSMKAPGTAYDNPMMGKDPQPDHMRKYDHSSRDNYGVHINSGIPNKAFYETAIAIGGNAWEAPGHIWYRALLASDQQTDFQKFANTTFSVAGENFGPNSLEQKAVRAAWDKVGIEITMAMMAKGRYAPGGDELNASLSKQLAALTAQVKALTKEVEGLKRK
jgi:Zn-dependent metalloprotease